MERRIVRTLYKRTLGVAREMGYVYGDWNLYVKKANPYNFRYNTIVRIRKQKKLGHYMGNNIRNGYKRYMNVTDKTLIDDLITDGFEALQIANWLKMNMRGR